MNDFIIIIIIIIKTVCDYDGISPNAASPPNMESNLTISSELIGFVFNFPYFFRFYAMR